MNVKKLDKRFKLYNTGLATSMLDVSVVDFHKVEQIMSEAYGPGQGIGRGVPDSSAVQRWRFQADWFYGYRDTKVTTRIQISTPISGPPVYSNRDHNVIMFRVYFRREEQAMYLALKMTA